MNQIEKETYAKIVTILFDGAVKAQPGQVTPRVAEMADAMFVEIATCHERLKPPSFFMHGVANSLYNLMPNELTLLFGHKDVKKYIGNTLRDQFAAMVKKHFYEDAKKANAAAKVLEGFYKSWKDNTSPDRKLRVCIVTAQSRWRSKIEMELMGL